MQQERNAYSVDTLLLSDGMHEKGLGEIAFDSTMGAPVSQTQRVMKVPKIIDLISNIVIISPSLLHFNEAHW